MRRFDASKVDVTSEMLSRKRNVSDVNGNIFTVRQDQHVNCEHCIKT